MVRYHHPLLKVPRAHATLLQEAKRDKRNSHSSFQSERQKARKINKWQIFQKVKGRYKLIHIFVDNNYY